MTKRVKIVMAAEFETTDERSASAVLVRLPGEVKLAIQESKLGHALTGVIPDSVYVEILERSIT